MPKFAKGTPTDWQWVEMAEQDVPDAIARDSEVDQALYGLVASLFGDGSDGDVTITGTVTLSREMLYNNLTVASGAVLDTANYRVWVRGTLTNYGVIHCDGYSANSRYGAPRREAYMTFGRSGKGGAGGTGAGSAGGFTYVLEGGLGGRGGSGGSGSAGAGGSSPAGGYPSGFPRLRTLFDLMMMCFIRHRGLTDDYPWGDVWCVDGGCGGGGGGGDGTNYGGGGGGGGGIVWIAARKIINNGTIRARGGNGYSPTVGNCGGGGGGGGGGIVLIYREKSGTGTCDVSGGLGGFGCGTGTAGANGQPGVVREFQV